jgi:hypothetical protein
MVRYIMRDSIKRNEPEGEAFRFNQTYAETPSVSQYHDNSNESTQAFPSLRPIGKAPQETHILNRIVTSWQK